MTKLLGDLQPVHVVGAGWHRYQPLSETSHVELGLTAVRGLSPTPASSGPVSTRRSSVPAFLGMAAGRPMLKHLGALGKPLVHVENARHRVGGVPARLHQRGRRDQRRRGRARRRQAAPGLPGPDRQSTASPTTRSSRSRTFSLLSGAYRTDFGVADEDLARVQ